MRYLLAMTMAMPLAVAMALGAACAPSHGEPTHDDAGTDADSAPLPAAWTPVLEHLDGALLSVWGTSENDVWTVGGPLGNSGFESLVMRFGTEPAHHAIKHLVT